MIAVAMKFSMIEEMTSLTPRVTLSTPMIPAQNDPTSMATTMMLSWCRPSGSANWPPNAAAMMAASWYCPSTPMLNRFIRKATATAMADR